MLETWLLLEYCDKGSLQVRFLFLSTIEVLPFAIELQHCPKVFPKGRDPDTSPQEFDFTL
jgi:hypothetical protein